MMSSRQREVVEVMCVTSRPGTQDSLACNSGNFPGGPEVKTSPFSAEDGGSIPDQGTQILHALWTKTQNIKQKQYCNKFKKKTWKIHAMLHILTLRKKYMKMVEPLGRSFVGL